MLSRQLQLAEAWWRGGAAYHDDLGLGDCPWDEDEDLELYNQWRSGWDEASLEHELIRQQAADPKRKR